MNESESELRGGRGIRRELVVPLLVLVLLAQMLTHAAGASTSEPAKEPAAGASETKKGEQASFYATTLAYTAGSALLVHFWSKGGLFRSETIVSGHPIISIVNGDQYYTLDLLTGRGVAIRRSREAVAADGARGRPFGNELIDLMAAGGEKVRGERLRGLDVEVYRVTDQRGKRTVWARRDALELPLRVETFERESGRTAQVDYVDWLPGLAIPDHFFAPPEGVELLRFESYADYMARLAKGPVPPAPPLFGRFLRGAR